MVTSPVKVTEETSSAASDDTACESDAGVKRVIDESENASGGEASAMEESPLKKSKSESEEEEASGSEEIIPTNLVEETSNIDEIIPNMNSEETSE